MLKKDNIITIEGDYSRFGTEKNGSIMNFTFEGEKESKCAIRLYEHGKEEFIDIDVPSNYCMGAVRSIGVSGIDFDKFDYNLVIEDKEIIDPYAKKIIGREKWGECDLKTLRGGFVDESFDWENDESPEYSSEEMVMYKLHVRGFTKDGKFTAKKGTFAAVKEKIPYLKELGVTTIELMPVYEFGEVFEKAETSPDFTDWNPAAIEGYKLIENEKDKEVQKKINFWGYGKGNYFAPKMSYAANPKNAGAELKNLIKAFHSNGMEVIMEMNFEDNLNPNFIVEILRFWVKTYHVDGFHLLSLSLPIEAVIEDVFLKRTKIFYHSFPDYAWGRVDKYQRLFLYNDDFLYTARKAINHIDGNTCDLLDMMKNVNKSISRVNYIANNNGFTLCDVFSYAVKHNADNGEDGADGNDWNYSVNCGVEGLSRKKAILEKRKALMKQSLAIVLLSKGIPLIYGGDEFGNSQNGNNNAYCQDNVCGWVNWKEVKKNQDLVDYVKELIKLRKEFSQFNSREAFCFNDYKNLGMPDVSYHDVNAWTQGVFPSLQMVGVYYYGPYYSNCEEVKDVYLGINLSTAKTSLALIEAADREGYKCILGEAGIGEARVTVPGNSVVVLTNSYKKEEVKEEKKSKGSKVNKIKTDK